MTEPRGIWESGSPRSAPTEPAPPPRRPFPLALVALGVVVVAAVGAAVLVLRSDPARTAGRTPAAVTPPPAPTPSVAPVANLSAEATAFAVTLTWTQAGGTTPAESYGIFRDGVELTAISPATTYTDATVQPGASYSYEVEARASGGSVLAGRVAVVVTTPVPALRSARVEGDFSVNVKVISQSGFETFTNNYTLGWHFDPACETGPCDVTWTDLAEKSLEATLTRAGLSYTGSDSGKFNVKCNDAEVKTTLTVAFDVTKAKGIDGEWRATKLKGTLTETESAQLGCVASKAVLSITATLIA
jgi:hypothetical protein